MSNEYSIYNKYKDRFSLFKKEYPDVVKKYPECAGDWDKWLFTKGAHLVSKTNSESSINMKGEMKE